MDGGHDHFPALHHHPAQSSSYCPPSPASSTNSSSKSNERLFSKPADAIPIPDTILSTRRVLADYPSPSHSSNHNLPAAHQQQPSQAPYGVNADEPPRPTFPPDAYPRRYHRSPPPEPSAPQAGHPSSWGQQYTYTRDSSPVIVPAYTPGSPARTPGPVSAPPDSSAHHHTWPEAPSPPPKEDTSPPVDELRDADDSPSQVTPPQSPPPGGSGSIHLLAPSAPTYHRPRLQYPISPPGNESHSSRTFSFISLPGHAMRKRPRRRYDEIERLYRCNFLGCTKSYGTLNHLNAHVSMQGHGQKRTPGEFKEMRKMWRKQKREAEHGDTDDADGDESAGPSISPTSTVPTGGSSAASSGRSKRKRRATEPMPNIITLDEDEDPSAKYEEEYGPTPSGSGAQHRANLDMSRRVSSMDDYRLPGASEVHDRRGSGGSGDGETTQGDEDTSHVPLPTHLGAPGPPPLGPGALGGADHPLHGGPAHVGSPGLPPSLPPMPMEPPSSGIQFWSQPPHQVSAMSHQAPISPTTIIPPVSHLPGPAPMSGVPAHHRQMSFPPSSYPPNQPQHPMMHPVYPPSVPMAGSSHAPVAYPPPPSAAQPHTPPSHVQPHSHHHSQAHLQRQHHHATSSPPVQYTASPPAPPMGAAQPLHSGSMLITPVSIGHPHRASYSSDAPGSAYGSGSGLGSSGNSGQGLPSVFDRSLGPREGMDDDHRASGGNSGAMAPPVHAPAWDSYASGPSHRQQGSDTYGAQPSTIGRPSMPYDPTRDYHPPRTETYGGQQHRSDSYPTAPQQPQYPRHDQHPYMPQRSVSYAGSSGSGMDAYAQHPPRPTEPSGYIPPRADAYGAVQPQHPPRGDPSVPHYPPTHRQQQQQHQDPYAAHRQQQYQQQADPQQSYQPLPPARHPAVSHQQQQQPGGLPPPSHLPHSDPRHDPYGRGAPGPGEGSYQ